MAALLGAAGVALTIGAVVMDPHDRAGPSTSTTLPTITPRPARDANIPDAARPDAAPEPPPSGPALLVGRRAVSEISPTTAQHLAAIAGPSDSRRPDVFAKIGGSSTVNRGFLHCFMGRHVELGDHQRLGATLEFFQRGRAERRSPFERISLSAGVGWNTGYLLSGRPPRYLREVLRVRPRYAFLLAGGNDVGGHDPYGFARRLVQMVEGLVERSVIPILGTLHPRSGRQQARTVRSFNRAIRGIAGAMDLPLIDYHYAMERLTNHGLAGDGVHPNVQMRGSMPMGCNLNGEGLRYGNNVRNLHSLRMLHRLHAALDQAVPTTREELPRRSGAGAEGAPFDIPVLPFAAIEELERGDIHIYELQTDRPLLVSLRAIGFSRRHNPGIYIEGRGEAAPARQELETTLPEGGWQIQIRAHDAQPDSARYLLTIDAEPAENGGAENPTRTGSGSS